MLKSPKIEFLGTMIGNHLYNLVVGVNGGTISPNKKGPYSFWMFSNLENSSVWDCELETGYHLTGKHCYTIKLLVTQSDQKWKKVFCVYVFVKKKKILCLTDSENNNFCFFLFVCFRKWNQ